MLNSRQRGDKEIPGRLQVNSDDGGDLDSGSPGLLTEDLPGRYESELRLRPEWQLACRVASSKGLCKSDLLPRFLLYVCEQQLLGNTHEITEQRIGTQIFNRPSDYNPGEDNIVRSYARTLRKRLDEYFEGDGSEEPLRIVIPRGGYVPTFCDREAVTEPVADPASLDSANKVERPLAGDSATEPEEPKIRREIAGGNGGSDGRREWLWMAAAVVAGALLASTGWLWFGTTQKAKAQGPAHAVWAEIFQSGQNTLIVPADSGLGILQNLTGHLISLEEYASGAYLSDMRSPPPGIDIGNLNDLRRQRYTSVVDLNITAMLTQLPEFAAGRPKIRYARSITTDDLKHSNAILLGSVHTNPWVSLFDKNLNFKLQYLPEVDQSFVENEHPAGNEQPKYRNDAAGPGNKTYGVIDYLPSLDGTGHVLIIQGLNMAATQAAADTLFSSEQMRSVVRQAALPNGSLRSFELLVETSSIGATAPSAQIIATRFYPG